MTNNRAENMKRLNQDSEFAAARNRRARERFTLDNERLQRMANIAKRGCDVPEWLEDQWRELKRMKIPNREAAEMLSIPYLGNPEDEVDNDHKLKTVTRLEDEQIDYIERLSLVGRLDPDIAYELIERCKRAKRVLAWNTEKEEQPR
ncbi:hypothetical protein [Roseovarius sp. SYSU LYC5161]|uniref:hypothetical protein n=1 Tax=Roseovarius halophilus (ex Wu et al. 2025) TaxID=3376060 RepID=UPI00399970C4